MALFDSVSRDTYEDMMRQRNEAVADRRASEERYAALVQQVIDIKRHEHGMNPVNFDASTLDPTHGLGPKTVAAIDEFANGDPELRRYLVSTAHMETGKRPDMKPDERDLLVANIIEDGDTQ